MIIENYSLKKLNTFGLDVKAAYFIDVKSLEYLEEQFELIRKKQFKYLVLGSGSNILFTKDYDGLVIKNSVQGIEIINETEKEIFIKTGGGVIWDNLVSFCIKNNYWGIENLSLIPGTVGAAPVQNIGAYGVELKDVFYSLDGIYLTDGKRKTFSKEESQFGYRSSIFKKELRNKFLITNVILRLSKLPAPKLNYRALREKFGSQEIKKISLSEIRSIVIEIRNGKLPNPAELGNAGSFYKNPVISNNVLKDLQKNFQDIVYFKIGDKYSKISAGWLIEKCGLKGFRDGYVGTYPKQALIIVNYGNATGKEIFEFSRMIQLKVKDKFGILLEPEVNIL